MSPSRLAAAAVLLLPSIALAAAAEGEEKAGGGGLFEPISFATIATSVITLLIFLGLLAVLAKFAWGPIVKSLEERENRIRGDIEAAEAARAEAEKAREEYRAELAGAEQRVRDLMAQAHTDGQQLATRIKMQAQEDAEEIKERANREIEQNRRDAVEQIRTEAAELAVAVAEKILRREVTAGDQSTLVNASLDELEKTDVTTA
ncbi:MAG: F0F1 ATP synthase subunit B [Planctomycetota bacterium]